MRNTALRLLTAAALAAPALPALAQTGVAPAAAPSGFESQKLAAIVDWLKADVEKGRIPGAVVLIARNGQIVLFDAVGWADKEK